MDRRTFAQTIAGVLLASRGSKSFALNSAVRFSFMLWALDKSASFDQRLETVAAAGYQGVELTGEFQRWTPEERQRILKRMGTLGLVVDSMSGVKAGFAVPDETQAFFAQFAEHLAAAKQLRCPQVILLSGKRVAGLDPSAQRAVAVDNLKRAAGMAEREGIEIVIEPIDFLENPSIFLASVTEAFAIAGEVNSSKVKVLYDLYHEQRSFGNLMEKLEKNVGMIGLIHVADVPGRHEPGTGEIQYAAIYRKLGELRYNRWIAMEFYPTGEPVGSLRAARVEALKNLGG